MPPDANLTPDQIAVLRDTLSRTKEKLQRLTTDHREFHAQISRVGRTIDRNFTSDYSSTTRNDVLMHEQNIQLLNEVIAQHLHRNNMDDVAQTLVHESNLGIEQLAGDPFSELHRIWEAIYNGDLREALHWTNVNSDKLSARNSSLEFKLHRIAFLQVKADACSMLLVFSKQLLIFLSKFSVIDSLQILDADNGGGSPIEAISYARKHFSKFVDKFEKDIQLLMGTLMYIPVGLENSPYKRLCGSNLLIEVSIACVRWQSLFSSLSHFNLTNLHLYVYLPA